MQMCASNLGFGPVTVTKPGRFWGIKIFRRPFKPRLIFCDNKIE